jgi:hypothetical protein
VFDDFSQAQLCIGHRARAHLRWSSVGQYHGSWCRERPCIPLPKVVPRRSSLGWSGWAVEPLWEVPDRPLLRLRAAQRLWEVPARAQPPVASEGGGMANGLDVRVSHAVIQQGFSRMDFPFPAFRPGCPWPTVRWIAVTRFKAAGIVFCTNQLGGENCDQAIYRTCADQ